MPYWHFLQYIFTHDLQQFLLQSYSGESGNLQDRDFCAYTCTKLKSWEGWSFIFGYRSRVYQRKLQILADFLCVASTGEVELVSIFTIKLH